MQHSPKTQSPHETRCQAKRVKLKLKLINPPGYRRGDTHMSVIYAQL